MPIIGKQEHVSGEHSLARSSSLASAGNTPEGTRGANDASPGSDGILSCRRAQQQGRDESAEVKQVVEAG
jgi:hypothetical protein